VTGQQKNIVKQKDDRVNQGTSMDAALVAAPLPLERGSLRLHLKGRQWASTIDQQT
jgi:hypothetical protein